VITELGADVVSDSGLDHLRGRRLEHPLALDPRLSAAILAGLAVLLGTVGLSYLIDMARRLVSEVDPMLRTTGSSFLSGTAAVRSSQ
jgi:hypothetical protein